MKQQEGAAALRGKLIPVAAISFFRSLHKSMKLNGDSIWTCVVLTAQSKSCCIYCRELLYILSRGFYFSQSQTLSCLQPPMNAQFGSFVLNSDYVQELIWRLIETPLYPRWRAKMNWYWCGFCSQRVGSRGARCTRPFCSMVAHFLFLSHSHSPHRFQFCLTASTTPAHSQWFQTRRPLSEPASLAHQGLTTPLGPTRRASTAVVRWVA